MIHSYVENLKSSGKYDEYAGQVLQFKLATQIFDVFGETVDNYAIHSLFTTTDTDLDRQLRNADIKLGRHNDDRLKSRSFVMSKFLKGDDEN